MNRCYDRLDVQCPKSDFPVRPGRPGGQLTNSFPGQEEVAQNPVPALQLHRAYLRLPLHLVRACI